MSHAPRSRATRSLGVAVSAVALVVAAASGSRAQSPGPQAAPIALEGPVAALLGETVVLRARLAADDARVLVTVDGAPITTGVTVLRVDAGLEVQVETATIAAPTSRLAVTGTALEAARAAPWSRVGPAQPADPGRAPLARAWRLDAVVTSAAGISRGTVVILDARPRVLVIEGRPRWEHRALARALLRDPGLDVQTLLLSADPGWIQAASPGLPPLREWPAEAELSSWDVIVLGDLSVDPEEAAAAPLTVARADALARWVLAGGGLSLIPAPDGRALWLEPLDELLPVELAGAESPQAGFGRRQVTPTPSSAAAGALRLDGDALASARAWGGLSPVCAWAVGVRARSDGETLLVLQGVHAPPGEEELEEQPYDLAPALVRARRGHGEVAWSAIDETWRWLSAGDAHARLHGRLVRSLALGSCLTSDAVRAAQLASVAGPRPHREAAARRTLDDLLAEARKLALDAAQLPAHLRRAMPALYRADVPAEDPSRPALPRPRSAKERLLTETRRLARRLERLRSELASQGGDPRQAAAGAVRGLWCDLELVELGDAIGRALERGEGFGALRLAERWAKRLAPMVRLVEAIAERGGKLRPGAPPLRKRLERLRDEHARGRWLERERADEVRELAGLLGPWSEEPDDRADARANARRALLEAFGYDQAASVADGLPAGVAGLHAEASRCLAEAAAALR